jgi:hypothetical protein
VLFLAFAFWERLCVGCAAWGRAAFPALPFTMEIINGDILSFRDNADEVGTGAYSK